MSSISGVDDTAGMQAGRRQSCSSTGKANSSARSAPPGATTSATGGSNASRCGLPRPRSPSKTGASAGIPASTRLPWRPRRRCTPSCGSRRSSENRWPGVPSRTRDSLRSGHRGMARPGAGAAGDLRSREMGTALLFRCFRKNKAVPISSARHPRRPTARQRPRSRSGPPRRSRGAAGADLVYRWAPLAHRRVPVHRPLADRAWNAHIPGQNSRAGGRLPPDQGLGALVLRLESPVNGHCRVPKPPLSPFAKGGG